jgi:tetratricopeptide (TPR) repeat protein
LLSAYEQTEHIINKKGGIMDYKQLLGEAQLLFVDGKEKESIEAFTKALEAGADPFIVYLSRGAAYLKLKEVDKAIDDFNKAIGVNNKNARAYYFRGMAFMFNNEFEKAVSDFSKALEIKTDLFVAKFVRATAYARMKKFEEAALDLKAVLPQMEVNLQSLADTYGILRTKMWKVTAQLSGESLTSTLQLTEEEFNSLRKWLEE